MTFYLKIEHDQTGDNEVFVNGSSIAGITLLRDGTNLGEMNGTAQITRTLDSFSVHVTGEVRETRSMTLSFLLEGTTAQTVQALIDRFAIMADKIGRRGSGTMYYRSVTGTIVTRYKIADMKVSSYGDIQDYETFYRSRVAVTLLVDPLGLKWPLDISDDFSVDTLGVGGIYNPGGADWTVIPGYATPVISNGVLTPGATSFATARGIMLTGTGNDYTGKDFEIVVKHYCSTTLTNYSVTVGLNSPTGGFAMYATIDNINGINIHDFVDSVSNQAAASMSVGATMWLVIRREYGRLFAEHWNTEPTQTGTPSSSISIDVSPLNLDAIATGLVPTLIYTQSNANDTIDEFKVKAYKNRNVTVPGVFPMNGTFGGTADAQAAVNFSMGNPGANAPQWIMFAWWPQFAKYNMVWNQGGEVVGSGVTAYGWQATAYSTLTAAATSVGLTSTAAKVRSDLWGIEAVCPATTNSGIAFPIYTKGKFRKNKTYRFACWVRSSTQTTNIRCMVGASSTAFTASPTVALSTTWQRITGAWTPTADFDEAAFAVAIQSAVATTFQVDDVVVWETKDTSTVEPTYLPGGYVPGIIPAIGYDSAKASVGSDGAFFSKTTPGGTLVSSVMSGTGVMGATANLEYHILPGAFRPDEFTAGEVDIAVFARVQQAATQTVTATLSIVPENGIAFGAAKYSEFYSTGKPLVTPGSTNWKLVYLGTVTIKADSRNQQRMKLRISFTNTGTSTGAFAVDYFAAVPSKNVAASRSGVQSAFVPAFIPQTGMEITKRVASDLSVSAKAPSSGSSQRQIDFTDSSLLLNRIMIPKDGSELLVLPSTQVCDVADVASLSSMVASHTATIQVEVQPQVHLLTQ